MQAIALRHFRKTTIRRLADRGITVLGSVCVPGNDGSFANGETAYRLDDNGTHRIRTFLQVLAIANGSEV